MALAANGQTDKALECFQGMLDLDPGNPMALTNAGTAELMRGRLDPAEKLLRRAVTTDASQATAWNGLGVIAARSGRASKAVEAWQQVLELDPNKVDTLYNLGMLLLEKQGLSAARPHLESFLKRAPQDIYDRDLERVREILGGD